MAGKVSLTFSDLSAEEASRILAVAQESSLESPEAPRAPDSALQSTVTDPLSEFVLGASANVAKLVAEIARNSVDGRTTTRAELMRLTGIHTVPEFSGLSGGTGKWWGRFFPDVPNPFVGEWSREVDDYLYFISGELASRTVSLLDE